MFLKPQVNIRFIFLKALIDPALTSSSTPDSSEAFRFFGIAKECFSDDNFFDSEYGDNSILDASALPIQEKSTTDTLTVDQTLKWLEKNLNFSFDTIDESPEDFEKLKQIIDDAFGFGTEIGLGFTSEVTNITDRLLGALSRKNKSQTLSSIKALLLGARSTKRKNSNSNTPYFCAFLKLLAVSCEYHRKPELSRLEEANNAFANEIIEWLAINNVSNQKDLRERLKQGPVIVADGHDAFSVENLYFRPKDKWSIFMKMLLKASNTPENIIKDGASGRIVLTEGNTPEEANLAFDRCHAWLEMLGFVRKPIANNLTRGDEKEGNDVYYNKLDETTGVICEIQVTTGRRLNKTEAGIYDHRIYKLKQKLLTLIRLLGSVTDGTFNTLVTKTFDQVKKKSSPTKDELINELKRFFFRVPSQTPNGKPRWSSYEFVGKKIRSRSLPVKYYTGFYGSLAKEFIPSNNNTASLNAGEWESIFQERVFPSRLKEDYETQEEIIRFLEKNKKGIPKVLICYLRLQSLLYRKKIPKFADFEHIEALLNVLRQPSSIDDLREEIALQIIKMIDFLYKEYENEFGGLRLLSNFFTIKTSTNSVIKK